MIRNTMVALLLCAVAGPALAEDAAEAPATVSMESYLELLERLDRLESELKEIRGEQEKAAAAPAPTPHVSAPADVASRPKEPGRFYFEGGPVILQSFGDQDTAFVAEDVELFGIGGGLPNAGFGFETSDSRDFNEDTEVAGRYELGFVPDEGLGWAARYFHFDSSDRVRRTHDPAWTVGQFETNFFDDPDIGIDTNVGDTLVARRELDLDLVDVEAMLVNRTSGGTNFTVTGGVRYLRANQSGQWRLIRGGTFSEIVNVRNDYEGAGPLLGASVRHALFERDRFSLDVFGLTRAGFIFGDGELELEDDNSLGVPGFNDVLRNERNNVVYTAEAQLGFEARFRPLERSKIEAYARFLAEGQFYANIGSIGSSAGASGDSDDADVLRDADLGFVGGTIMFGIRAPFGGD